MMTRTSLLLSPDPAASRGMAVLGALLVVMVATVLVTGLLQRQAADVRAMEGTLAGRQARQILLGGLDWAQRVLDYDARRSATTHPDGQLWAIPLEDTRISQPGSERVAVFSGYIEDAQARFNLTNLARNGEIQPRQLLALQRLFRLLGQPDGLAPLIARRVALGQRVPAKGDVAGRAPDAPALLGVDDLLLLEGIAPSTLDMLRTFATVLPAATAINANTASAEVLSAAIPELDIGQARALVAQRDRGAWFNDAADFSNRLADPEIQIAANSVDVNSAWFLVKGAVTLDNTVVALQALLHRPERGLTETVWTRELH